MKENKVKPTKKDLVNLLIKQSFGKDFAGDYHSNQFSGPSRVSDLGLHMIAKERFLVPKVIGYINEDGSKLELFSEKEYKISARKYAELYQKEFNEEVTITYH